MPNCAECEALLVDEDMRVVPWDRVYKYINHMNTRHNVGLNLPRKEGQGFERWQPWETPQRNPKK